MDLMIDYETLDTRRTAVCPSIGAVFFDTKTGNVGPTFYAVMDIDDQIAAGRTVSGDTIKWWMKQSDEARRLFLDKSFPMLEVITKLNQWVKTNTKGERVHVWGNGSNFDIEILASQFEDCKIPTFWKHWDIMDLRTFRRFVGKGKKVVVEGTAHNALDDAYAQAQYVIQQLKGKK